MTPTIAPLRNVAALMGVVDQVHNRDFRLPGMAAFYGPSGWDKSSAIVVVANEFQAHCVQVMESSTPTFLLETIMDELGLPKMRGGSIHGEGCWSTPYEERPASDYR